MFEKYTAEDYRKAAKTASDWAFLTTAEMLRQAADAMEREDRRELKYEYKVVYCRCDGRVYDSMSHAENIQSAREILGVYSGYKDAHIVRRSVGEWEEVKE